MAHNLQNMPWFPIRVGTTLLTLVLGGPVRYLTLHAQSPDARPMMLEWQPGWVWICAAIGACAVSFGDVLLLSTGLGRRADRARAWRKPGMRTAIEDPTDVPQWAYLVALWLVSWGAAAIISEWAAIGMPSIVGIFVLAGGVGVLVAAKASKHLFRGCYQSGAQGEDEKVEQGQ